MSRRIGLFGGTFDPVHLGHRYLAEKAFEGAELDKLIVMPAKIPPHKSESGLTTGQQRLDMCRLAFSGFGSCEVSDFELMQSGKSYSCYTVRRLRELYPDDRLFFIMGSDQFLTFEKWYRYSEILEMTDIIAFSRESGVDARQLRDHAQKLCGDSGKVLVLEAEPFEISSTRLREMLKNNEDCSCFIDEKVVEYIKANNLYRSEESH